MPVVNTLSLVPGLSAGALVQGNGHVVLNQPVALHSTASILPGVATIQTLSPNPLDLQGQESFATATADVVAGAFALIEPRQVYTSDGRIIIQGTRQPDAAATPKTLLADQVVQSGDKIIIKGTRTAAAVFPVMPTGPTAGELWYVPEDSVTAMTGTSAAVTSTLRGQATPRL